MKEFGIFPKPAPLFMNPEQRIYYGNGVFHGQRIVRRREAFVRDGCRCLACETKSFLTIDHIVPKAIVKTLGIQSLGYPNWQILCQECNLEKGTEIITYRTDFGKLHAITKYIELCLHLHRKPEIAREGKGVFINDTINRTIRSFKSSS